MMAVDDTIHQQLLNAEVLQGIFSKKYSRDSKVNSLDSLLLKNVKPCAIF